MEEKKLNEVMMRAINTVETGVEEPFYNFKSPEEYKYYLITVKEMQQYKGKKVVWMPE